MRISSTQTAGACKVDASELVEMGDEVVLLSFGDGKGFLRGAGVSFFFSDVAALEFEYS